MDFKPGCLDLPGKKSLSEFELSRAIDPNSAHLMPNSVDCLHLAQTQSDGHIDRPSTTADAKIRINTPFSLKTLHNVFASFDSEKRALIHSIGFGGLLKVHNQRLQCRDLILYLLRSMDPNTGIIQLSSGELTVNDKDVHLVLGIPLGGQEVNLCARSHGVLDKVKRSLLLDSDCEVNMEVVIGILLKEYGRKLNAKEREAFKVAAVIFADSCFLGPRGDKRRINKDILEHVADSVSIRQTNWSGYVLGVLRQSAAKIQHNLSMGHKTVILDGCLLFLLVFYLDNLCAGFMTPPHNILPRIAKYTPRLLSELVSYDRRRKMPHSKVQFGRAKLRPCEEVVYSRSSDVNTKVPPSCGEQPGCRMSTGKIITGCCSDNFPESQIHNCKAEVSVDFNEAHLAFEEYIEAFNRQVAQATEELRRKVHVLLDNFPYHASTSSELSRDIRGDSENHELMSSITTRLGLKASTRRYYMTVTSSSCGSSSAYGSSPVGNVDQDDLFLGNSATSPAMMNTASENLLLSTAIINEGVPRAWSLGDATEGTIRFEPINSSGICVFGPSPFSLDLKDKDVPLKAIMEVIRLLPRLRDEERMGMWYMHNVPTNLEIDGETLYLAFYKDVEFKSDIMNAAMRLFHDLDDELYEGCHVKRWRHYLPATWAVLALEDENLCNIDLVGHMFTGAHLSYKFEECQMVFLPVSVGTQWSLYAWDFARKQVTIFDPLISNIDRLKEKHKHAATKLHKYLLACKKEIFGNSLYLNIKWHLKYLPGNHENTRYKSGLYTVFFSRFFDGQACTRSMMMEDSVTLFQTSLLCQLLLSKGNKGTCPTEIISAITSRI